MTYIVTTQKPVWAMKARTGPMRRYKNLTFFACEGLIAVHDVRDDGYTVVLPDDFELRSKALAQESKIAKEATKLWQRQEKRELLRFCQDMLDAVDEARYMGDPSSPEVHAFWQRHNRQAGLPHSGCSNPKSYPRLPALPVGNFTGRTADPETLPAISPAMLADPGVPLIHTPPKRKPRPGKLLLADAL